MLRWVVVGIGDIAKRRVIPAIQAEPRSELYGVVTRDAAKGARYAEHVWERLEDALADADVDAVYLATPVFLHAPQTLAALAARKHVICEKPMAVRYEDAERMTSAARGSGCLLCIAYYRRLYPKLQRARALLREGAIGKPVMAYATAHDWFQAENGDRSWLLDPKKAGGGPLYDTACHRIDAFNYLFGEPRLVAAQRSNAVHQIAVEDNATVLVQYENGVRGIVDVRRHSHIGRDEFRVIGTEGELELSPLNGPQLESPCGVEELPPHANLHYPLVENFVTGVLDGAPLASTGETALPTEWVIAQAMRS